MILGIFGTGRNGSTLIGRLLDGIRGVYIHPEEINFLSALNDLAVRPRVRRKVNQNAFLGKLKHLSKALRRKRLLDYYNSHIEAIRINYLSKKGDSHFNNPWNYFQWGNHEVTAEKFVIGFLKAMAAWLIKDKTIEHYAFKSIETPFIADYESRFPDMRFLHIIRNPLDVCSSQKRTLLNKRYPASYLGVDNLETMIERRWIPHARFILQKGSSGRHLSITYEELTGNAIPTIQRICQWLEWKMPKEPEKLTVLGGQDIPEFTRNPSKKDVETPAYVISNLQEKLAYEEVLTKREKDLIVSKTYHLAQALGYFKNIPQPSRFKILCTWFLPEHGEFIHWKRPALAARGLLGLLHRRWWTLSS